MLPFNSFFLIQGRNFSGAAAFHGVEDVNMGQANPPVAHFAATEAEEFKRTVLAGCDHLDLEELRSLADEIHQMARERRTKKIDLKRHASWRPSDEDLSFEGE